MKYKLARMECILCHLTIYNNVYKTTTTAISDQKTETAMLYLLPGSIVVYTPKTYITYKLEHFENVRQYQPIEL